MERNYTRCYNSLAGGKILGKVKPPKGQIEHYSVKKFTVYILYDKKEDNYSDKDIVFEISLHPDDRGQLLARYIKKLPNFHKDFKKGEVDDKISHVKGLAYYMNQAGGFNILVQKNDKGEEVITGFIYRAPN